MNSLRPVDQVLSSLALHHALLRDDARTADRTGVIGEEVTTALTDAGVHRLPVDGELTTGDLVRLGTGIATHHPSAAWNCIVSVTNALLARQFLAVSDDTDTVTTLLSGAPDAQWCGVFASPGCHAHREPSGGHSVTGTWRYASNSAAARYALLNVIHEDLGPCFILIPRDRLVSRDDWASLGLRATGSHTLEGTGLHVPTGQLLTAADLYREDPRGPVGLRVPSRIRTAFGLTSVAVGTAEALAAELLSGASARKGVARPDYPTTVGDAVSRIHGAGLMLADAAETLDRDAEDASLSEVPPSSGTLSTARLAVSRVVRDIADAAHELSLIAGAGACLEGSDVGRLWRDTHVATRHAALSPAVGFDLGGRSLLDPDTDHGAEAAAPLAPGAAGGASATARRR